MPASMAVVTDSNRPQPLWQPPPTTGLTASGAVYEVPSLLMHPCPPPPPEEGGEGHALHPTPLPPRLFFTA